MRNTRLALALLLGALAACGDDDDGPGGEDECVALVDTVCERLIDCHVEAGSVPESDRAKQLKSCNEDLVETLECSRVVDVEDGYPECIDDVQAMTCEEITASTVTIPASCNGVLLVE